MSNPSDTTKPENNETPTTSATSAPAKKFSFRPYVLFGCGALLGGAALCAVKRIAGAPAAGAVTETVASAAVAAGAALFR